MSTKNNPPFRADHVGSLLRPKALFDAWGKRAKMRFLMRNFVKRKIVAFVRRFGCKKRLVCKASPMGSIGGSIFTLTFWSTSKGLPWRGEFQSSFIAIKERSILLLDLESSEDPAHGRQAGVAYNGHFRKNCCHPLFCFTSSGICFPVWVAVRKVE